MLPNFLRDSYRQYKDDTDRFATWLVNIAKKSGYEPESSAVKHTDGTAADKKKPKSEKASPEAKHSATISQLLAYGEAVAKSAVDVPASVLTRVKRAIKLRSDVTSHYLGKGDFASNKRHAHFVQVLEQICELLECKTSDKSNQDKRKGKQTQSSQTDTQAWLNRFVALTVEETEDIPEPAATTGTDGIIKVEVVEDDDDASEEGPDAHLSDAYFRLLCLFHDLQNWRAFIAQTWTEYRDMKVDLATASVVTDNALQLARDLMNDVIDSWPHDLSGDETSLQHLVYVNASLARGGLQPASTELGMTFNENMADVADWIYLPTASLLESFIPVIQDNSVPIYKPETFGTYDPKADRTKMSTPDKFQEDMIILLELLPEFSMVKNFGVPLPVMDEITNGFIDSIRDRHLSLWLCFAAQILLDTHHILRTSRLGAFADLRMSGKRIARTIDDFWELSKSHPKPVFWPKEGDQEIWAIRKSIETFIENDPLGHMQRQAYRELAQTDQKPQNHLLFSRQPVLCGLIMMHLNLRMQTIGQYLVNQWYDVQQLAFLYNLVQQSPGRAMDWPDIEMFIKIHGENNIFVGDRPKEAGQSLNRLQLATGVSSATRFASDARHRDGTFHVPDANGNQRVRHIGPTTKVANLFRHAYMSGDGSSGARVIASSNVEKLLDELSDEAAKKSGKSKKGGKKAGKVTTELSSKPQQLVGLKWANTYNIGPLQLLTLIKAKLCEEEPVILFNYFGMHRRAVELLRRVQAKEHHKFVQYFTKEYMPDDSMIVNLVLLIHIVAQGSETARRSMAIGQAASRNGSDGVNSRMVHSCGDVMRDYLRRNGDAACRELRTFCRNKAQVKALESSSGSDSDKEEAENESFGYWFSLEEALGPVAMASLMTGIPTAR